MNLMTFNPWLRDLLDSSQPHKDKLTVIIITVMEKEVFPLNAQEMSLFTSLGDKDLENIFIMLMERRLRFQELKLMFVWTKSKYSLKNGKKHFSSLLPRIRKVFIVWIQAYWLRDMDWFRKLIMSQFTLRIQTGKKWSLSWVHAQG